jgi:hypothetical protein
MKNQALSTYRTTVWRRPCAVSFNLLNASGMCACNDWQFYDPHPLIADVIISSFMTGVCIFVRIFGQGLPVPSWSRWH